MARRAHHDTAGGVNRAAILLLLLVCGCAHVGQRWGTPGEARVALRVNPHTLIGLFAIDQRLIDLTQMYTQPLVGIGEGNKPAPVLCDVVPTVANGGVSKDGRTLTYHLRRGIQFADGAEFTSADVAFTYRVIMDPRNPVSDTAAYRRISSLEAPDRYTVRMHFAQPWFNAPKVLFAAADFVYGILPAHAFNGNTDVTHAAWGEHPFGTGPFRVVSWRRGDAIVFEPNPHAWQPPHLRRIIVKFVPDQNASFVGLQNHSLDMVELSEAQVAPARALPSVNVVRVPRNETEFAHFNLRSPVVADNAVREAITKAIDRAAIARNAFYGLSPLATTEVSYLFPEHDATITPPPFDPEAAHAYFSANPLKGAVRIIVDNSSVNDRNAATVIQSQLLAAGIPAELHAYPSDVIYAPAPDGAYYGGKFDLEMGGWYGGLDAEQSEYYTCAYVAPHGPNTSRVCDAQYDAAFDRRDFAQMQRRIANLHVIIPFVYLNEYLGLNANLKGVKTDMLYNFGNTAQWDMR